MASLQPDADVKVVFTKYDGRAHRCYPARRLGTGHGGTWLGVASGTIALIDGGTNLIVRDEPHVLFVPDSAWFTAMFNAPPRRSEIYCDVTTPARWKGTTVRIVDLDLDVRRRRWGEIERLDEDEFERHRVRYRYPEKVVVEARRASDWLLCALGDGTEPFADAFRPWLAQVTA